MRHTLTALYQVSAEEKYIHQARWCLSRCGSRRGVYILTSVAVSACEHHQGPINECIRGWNALRLALSMHNSVVFAASRVCNNRVVVLVRAVRRSCSCEAGTVGNANKGAAPSCLHSLPCARSRDTRMHPFMHVSL